ISLRALDDPACHRMYIRRVSIEKRLQRRHSFRHPRPLIQQARRLAQWREIDGYGGASEFSQIFNRLFEEHGRFNISKELEGLAIRDAEAKGCRSSHFKAALRCVLPAKR